MQEKYKTKSAKKKKSRELPKEQMVWVKGWCIRCKVKDDCFWVEPSWLKRNPLRCPDCDHTFTTVRRAYAGGKNNDIERMMESPIHKEIRKARVAKILGHA